MVAKEGTQKMEATTKTNKIVSRYKTRTLFEVIALGFEPSMLIALPLSSTTSQTFGRTFRSRGFLRIVAGVDHL